MKAESNEAYMEKFSVWDKCLKDAKVKSCEELYKKIHDEIRKNPVHVKREPKK